MMAAETHDVKKGVVKALPQESKKDDVFSSVYFWKIRKFYDMEEHTFTRYSPDAFFLGHYGFRANYLRKKFTLQIFISMYLTHFNAPMHRPIRGRILIVDANDDKKQETILLKEEVRHNTDDWARGLEMEFDVTKWKDYACDGSYILRFEVTMI